MQRPAPNFKAVRGGYELQWGLIRAEVRRVRRSGDDFRCELFITHQMGDHTELIFPPTNINLMAARSVATLAKDLAEEFPGDPWRDMLRQLVFLVVESERQGEPPIDMAALEEPEELPWVIKNWVSEGVVTGLFGMGGSGKTYLALLAATCVASGRSYLGHQVPEPRKVLLLDYENDPQRTRRRLGMIARGLQIAVPPILYMRLGTPLVDIEDQIAQRIERAGVGLVILDSMTVASGGSQNKDELIVPVYSLLRRLNVAALVIDHESKDSRGEYAIGTIVKHNQSRHTFHVQASGQREDAVDLYMLIRNRKANDDAFARPLAVRALFSPVAVTFAQIRPEDMPSDLQEGLSVRSRLLASFNGHGRLTTSEVAELAGVEIKEAGKRLGELERAGKIIRLATGGGRGRPTEWGLKSDRISQFGGFRGDEIE